MFAPIKPPPSEDAAPQEAPVAAPTPAKASAKGAAAKAPAAAAAKGPAKGAAAAVDQAPPLGAPELGRAVELLGAQVHKYYTWREAATVHGLLPEAVTKDDLAGYRSLLSDIPQVCAHIPILRPSHKVHPKLSAHCSSKALCEAWMVDSCMCESLLYVNQRFKSMFCLDALIHLLAVQGQCRYKGNAEQAGNSCSTLIVTAEQHQTTKLLLCHHRQRYQCQLC